MYKLTLEIAMGERGGITNTNRHQKSSLSKKPTMGLQRRGKQKVDNRVLCLYLWDRGDEHQM